MKRHLDAAALLALIVALFALAACDVQAGTPSVSGDGFLLPMSTETSNAQATLAALQTQEKSSADAQAAATAEIMRANAQATLNAVSATLGAAQTQEQNNANIIAAQVAATAEIIRANAQATLVAAGSTQSAALTQDSIRQTQVQSSFQVTADLATQNAIGTVTQQNSNFLAAGTQTAVSNGIATQTQSALIIAQGYADQDRLRNGRNWDQIALVGMGCLLISVPIVIGLALGISLRWLKNRVTPQRLDAQPAEPPFIIEHKPRSISDMAYNQYPLAKPRDHVRRWLEEVKRKMNTNAKDDHDKPGS